MAFERTTTKRRPTDVVLHVTMEPLLHVQDGLEPQAEEVEPVAGRAKEETKRNARAKAIRRWALGRSGSSQEMDVEQVAEDKVKKLEEKLASAEKNRNKVLEDVRRRAGVQTSRSERVRRARETKRSEMQKQFERAMESASQNREQIHEEKMEKLARRSARVEQVLTKQKKSTEELLERFADSLRTAEKLRLDNLENSKEYARKDLERVSQARKALEEQQKKDKETILMQLQQRLERASSRRHEQLCSVVQAAGSPLHKARERTMLLRSSSCRKLQKTWKNFCQERRTTACLSQEFADLGICSEIAAELDFDSLSCALQKPRAITHTASFLKRLQSKYLLTQKANELGSEDPCLLLLNKLFSTKADPVDIETMPRYPVRVFLCAYMIIGHPDVVLGGVMPEQESMLQVAATEMLSAFECLHEYLQRPPAFQNATDGLLSPPSSPEKTARMLGGSDHHVLVDRKLSTFTGLLYKFDDTWQSYLSHFIKWKVSDSEVLEADLVEMACKMMSSMVLKGALDEEHLALSPDLQAVFEQVTKDVGLIRERMFKLKGQEGCHRFDQALDQTKEAAAKRFEEVKQSRLEELAKANSPPLSPQQTNVEESELSSQLPAGSPEDLAWDGSFHNGLTNEQIILELVYNNDWRLGSSSALTTPQIQESPLKSLREQVQSTMEHLFWEGIKEELVQIPLSTDALERLAVEIYDDISAIIPRQLVSDIREVLNPKAIKTAFHQIDTGIDYLHDLLKNTLALIRQLGAPAQEEESLQRHKSLLKTIETAPVSGKPTAENFALFVPCIVDAFRFVLQETKRLKLECANARLQLMARGLLRGKSAYAYMKTKFCEKFKLPTSSMDVEVVKAQIPMTYTWYSTALSTQMSDAKERVGSYLDDLSNEGLDAKLGAPSVVRSGLLPLHRKSSSAGNDTSDQTSSQQTLRPAVHESRQEILCIRLGILGLISQQDALNPAAIPETILYDYKRLLTMQDSFQRLMFLAATSIVVQQRLRGKVEHLGMHIEKCAKRVDALLNHGQVVMADIAAELAMMTNSAVGVESEAENKSSEEIIAKTLISMTKRDGNARLALLKGIHYAVEALLLLGDTAPGCKAACQSLTRCGAAHLLEDCKQMAINMAIVAEVQHLTFSSIFDCITNSFQE